MKVQLREWVRAHTARPAKVVIPATAGIQILSPLPEEEGSGEGTVEVLVRPTGAIYTTMICGWLTLRAFSQSLAVLRRGIGGVERLHP